MPSSDRVILAAAQSALPLDYTVPATQEVEPLIVTASFDGASASGTFVPTLEIISDAGIVVARVPTTTQVSAGGSADVTFAPFLRGDVVAAPPSGTAAVPSILYDFTVSTPQSSIDTAVDGAYAGTLSQAFYLLEMWWYFRTDEAALQSPVSMRINADSGANYDRVVGAILAGGGGLVITSNVGTTALTPSGVEGATSTANYFSVVRQSWPNYAGTSGYKTGEAQHAHPETVTLNNLFVAPQTMGWRSTSGISRFTVFPATAGVKFVAGSRMLIYGR